MHRALALACSTVLLVACGSPSPEPHAEPAAGDPTAPLPAPLPDQPPPSASPSTPSEATPTTPATPPRIVEPEAGPAALHWVATREGELALLPYHGAPFVVLDGEPIPWVDGRFTPEPGSARGLLPLRDPMVMMRTTVAIGGGLQDPRPTFVTTERYDERVSSVYEVHQRRGGRWRLLDLRKPPLVAHYSAYVERDGALLGLRTWDIADIMLVAEDFDQEAPERSEARYEANRRMLERSRPSWARLAGPAITLPEIPTGALLVDAVGTPDGSLFAIDSPRGEGAMHRLLLWPPGTATAEAIALPGLERAWGIDLTASGDWVLAYGSLAHDEQPTESYLAVGQGRDWERIPVELPPRGPDGTVNLVGAARTTDGELWIALGFRDFEPSASDDQPVWRRPVGGAWEPVALPSPPPEPFGPPKGWIFEGMEGRFDWTEIERGPLRMSPAKARGLTWAADAVWVTLELGGAQGGRTPRTVVLTNRPPPKGFEVLPPGWETELQRHDADVAKAEPGSDGCEVFSLVLGPSSLAHERPELPATLDALELASDTFGAIYVGRLGNGKAKLVVRTFAMGAPRVLEVREAVETATGLSVTLDCRIARLRTMVRPGPQE